MTNLGELAPLLKREGFVRTDMDCHGCTEAGYKANRFIAEINYSLNGNHQIECPRCGHIHYRLVKDGVVTEERYSSGYPTHVVKNRDLWKAESVPMVTSTASAFMRELWLNRDRD
jgi:uncharacterized C2H2 Zn-finger protein